MKIILPKSPYQRLKFSFSKSRINPTWVHPKWGWMFEFLNATNDSARRNYATRYHHPCWHHHRLRVRGRRYAERCGDWLGLVDLAKGLAACRQCSRSCFRGINWLQHTQWTKPLAVSDMRWQYLWDNKNKSEWLCWETWKNFCWLYYISNFTLFGMVKKFVYMRRHTGSGC